MSGRKQTGPEGTRNDAAGWVVRLTGAGAGEAEWLAFSAWLEETPGGREAYDAALALWLLADQVGADTREHDRRGGVSRKAPLLSRFGGMAALGLGGLGAAISAVVVMTLHHAPVEQARHPAASATVYAAAPGQRRSVVLADGTRLDLSGGSRVEVALEARQRSVTMNTGEVAFAVAHDPSRPFAVSIGDRQVRDLGTEFDIRRAGSTIQVTVRTGEVEVASNGAAAETPIALGAGRQLLHDEVTGVSSVRRVSADDVFAWKQGRLIYRDQPLRVVVDDLNRTFPHTVRIEGDRIAALRFTGVLAVDGEEATIRRLVALLPISATRVGDETVLRARETNR
jgi:transmembrane sensor